MRSHATGCLKGNRMGGAPILHQLPFAYNTSGISAGVLLGEIEASVNDPVWVKVLVRIGTAFNASTNAITVGTTTTATEWLPATYGIYGVGFSPSVLDTIAVAATPVPLWFKLTADTKIYVKYTQTGTAATTGAGDVLVEMIPGNKISSL